MQVFLKRDRCQHAQCQQMGITLQVGHAGVLDRDTGSHATGNTWVFSVVTDTAHSLLETEHHATGKTCRCFGS